MLKLRIVVYEKKRKEGPQPCRAVWKRTGERQTKRLVRLENQGKKKKWIKM